MKDKSFELTVLAMQSMICMMLTKHEIMEILWGMLGLIYFLFAIIDSWRSSDD